MKEGRKYIDQLFKEAARNEKAPAYNSAYWTEMGALLDARDKRRKKAGFLWVGLTALVIVLGISTFAIIKSSQNTQELYVKTQVELNPLSMDNYINNSANKAEISEVENTNTFDINSTKEGVKLGVNPRHQEMVNQQIETEESNIIPNFKVENLAINANLQEEKTISSSAYSSPLSISDNSINLLPIKQSAWNSNYWNQALITSRLKVRPKPIIGVYAKLGMGIMENYKTSHPFESGIFDFSLNMEIRIKQNVLIRTGIGSQITTHADLVFSKRYMKKELELVEKQVDLAYQNLYDIYLPIEFGYRHNRTAFGTGLQINYLVSTRLSQNEYTNGVINSSFERKNTKEGLNDFSVQGYLWFEQGITNRISIGAKVGTTITSRINEMTVFSNKSSTTKPLYGQVSLRYTIW